jgi:hypothetical protein
LFQFLSPPFYYYSGPGPAAAGAALLLTPIFNADNPAQRYLEWNSKGYLLLDITHARAQGTYCYVSTITSKSFTTDCSTSLTTQSGANHLVLEKNGVPVGTTSAPVGPTSGNLLLILIALAGCLRLEKLGTLVETRLDHFAVTSEQS